MSNKENEQKEVEKYVREFSEIVRKESMAMSNASGYWVICDYIDEDGSVTECDVNDIKADKNFPRTIRVTAWWEIYGKVPNNSTTVVDEVSENVCSVLPDGSIKETFDREHLVDQMRTRVAIANR